MKEKIVLASKSPRRIEFLKNLGLEFEIIPSTEEEKTEGNLTPFETAKTLALKKALSVKSKVGKAVIISADSIVVADGCILGKPADKMHAKKMLKKLSGVCHEVITGYAVLVGEKVYNGAEVSKVKFNVLSEKFIDDYVATGSPLDKAGAYGIQDGGLVESYEGSYTNIVGLPMEIITQILKQENLLK